MALTFSLAHLTNLSCTPPELIRIAADAGYEYASPRIIMTGTANEIGYNYDLNGNPAMYRETRQAIADTGLKIHDIELVRIVDSLDPRTLMPTFEIAAELGVHHVLSSIWTDNIPLATELYAQLCEIGRGYGLNISLEFVTWAKVTNLRGALEVLRAANQENARLAIDLLHVSRSHVSVQELAAVPPELYSFVHLCDGAAEIPTTEEGLIYTGRAERLYCGEGGIDIIGYLNVLPAIPYSIELPHLERVKELGNAGHAARCLQTAKDYFAAHSFDGPEVSTAATPTDSERNRVA
jgi:sugar phosphate isomerase/epimerase